MNPLSGFMQAGTGSASGSADPFTNIGKNVSGRPENGDAILLTDDNARSFLAWVQNFTNHSAVVEGDRKGVFDLQVSDFDPELPVLEHMQALNANATDQTSTDGNVSQTMMAQSVEAGHVPLLQGVIDAVTADHEPRPFAGTPSHVASSDLPEMKIEQENTPAAGQTRAAANGRMLKPSDTGVLSQTEPVGAHQEKTITSADKQIQAAKELLFQPVTSSVTTQAAQANGRPVIDHQLDGTMMGDTRGEMPEKQISPSLTKPVAVDIDNEQTRINRLTQERLSSGEGIAEKSNRPATDPGQPIAGQSKDSKSTAMGLAEQKTLSSEDDPANSRGRDKPNPTPRVAMVDINEDDWQKSQPSDPVKGTVPEQTRPQPSFQDAVKGLAGDPSTHTAVKPTAGQSTAVTQTGDTAAKTFQTTVMDQIVDKAAMRSIRGRSEIQIRLKPEFLGQVQMNIAADKEQLLVRIITDQPMVKEIIETHLHQLRTELQNQGLTIDKFEVVVNPDADQQHSRDQFAQMFKQHASQNGRRQPPGQEPETWHRDGDNHPDADQPDRDGINYFA